MECITPRAIVKLTQEATGWAGETGIRTNEIGLIIKTEIGLMEIGLILF